MSPCAMLRGVLAFVILTALAAAQVSAEEHASHHPDQGAEPTTRPSKGTDDGQEGEAKATKGMEAPGGMGKGMGKGMGQGKGMGKKVPSEKTELVPMFMNLGEVTPERVKEIQALARTRAAVGLRHMRHSLDQMMKAFKSDDLALVEAGAAGVRDGLSQFESGIAAARALAERRSPQNTALQWLRKELHLVPRPTPPKGLLWGFSGMHIFFMALVAFVALTGITLYWRRLRRASYLLEQMATTKATPPPSATKVAGDADTASSGLVPVQQRKHCKLRVAHIRQETPDVKTFRFVACDGGRIGFGFLPGQFMTLGLPISGEKPVRRSYTISSSPTQAFYCEITVKREDQGLGSRYLHDEVKEGDALAVQAPNGRFTFTGKEANSIVLIAGGVGITPMMSITRALTDMGWTGEIYFIAAIRDPENFIFRDELESLNRRHSNLHLHVAASRLQDDVEGFEKGRLNRERLAGWVPDIGSHWIHICGATPMMASTKEMLAELGVPAENIHIESFGSDFKPGKKADAQEAPEGMEEDAAGAELHFLASDKKTRMLANETVLEASERVGCDIESSCRSGMCGVCAVKLVEGEVEMETEDGLEPGDREKGMILSCVSRCSEDIVVDA